MIQLLKPESGLTAREIERLKPVFGQTEAKPEIEYKADVYAWIACAAGVANEVYKRASDRDGVPDETLKALSVVAVSGLSKASAYQREHELSDEDVAPSLAYYPEWMYLAGVRPSDDEF